MKICAIVLNYRDAARTEACLCSLIGQGLDAVLVVDNSADEQAASEFAAMMTRLMGHIDYALRLIDPQANLGFARGVNLALSDEIALRCDAFLLINNDAVAMPGMVGCLASRLAGAGSMMAVPSVIDTAGKPKPMLWYQRFFGLQTAGPLPGSFPYPSGCCFLARCELLEGGRLFDEDFFMYGEDTQLGWRLVRTGKTFQFAGDAVVRHASGGSSRQGQLFYEYHTARSHILLSQKSWYSRSEIPFLLLSKGVGLSLRALRRCIRFGSVVPLLAFILAWFPMNIRTPQ